MATLADQARKLAGGDLEQRVTTGRRVVEMENLAQAFNRLASDLQARMRELSGERDEIQAIIDSLDEGVLALDVFPEEMTAPLVNRYLEIKARHLL